MRRQTGRVAGRKPGVKLKDRREYRIYNAMLDRCCNKNSYSYKWYGAKGITVCKRWLTNFEAFFEDMGPCPPNLTIERKNNKLGYSKSNCKWATWAEQSRNRCATHNVTIDGVTHCLADWSKISGVEHTTILIRLQRGVPPTEAVFTKPKTKMWNVPKSKSNDHIITAFGKSERMVDWCREYSISCPTLLHRLGAGWSPEDALTLPIHTVINKNENAANFRFITAFGKTMKMADWSKEYGRPSSVIYHRLKTGWSPENAVSLLPSAFNRFKSMRGEL